MKLIARVKVRPACKFDSLTAICEPQRLTTLLASTACYRDSFMFYFLPLTDVPSVEVLHAKYLLSVLFCHVIGIFLGLVFRFYV
jgi:hypothetical protein